MMGWPSDSWMELLTWPVVKTILLDRDPLLLKEFRLAFQQGFDILFLQLQGQHLTKAESEQVQLYISNCLSILPYADLTPYESFKIPQNINSEWILVEYYITPIELTPRQGFRSQFIHDQDRVFAYGLDPIVHPNARSHLIFMGTTYPAGQGFLPQIKTDLKGFQTVGASLYHSGKKSIKEWLIKHKETVNVCGLSLGGSLSLLLAIDEGNYLNRVDALNPAGLHDSWYKNEYDNWDEMESKPQVVVQIQGDDPASLFGIWKKDWQILKVKAPDDKKGPNAFADHFLNYARFAQTVFEYADPTHENSERAVRNFLIYSLGRGIVYYTILVPFNYVVRPFAHFIMANLLPVLLGIIFLVSFSIFITMASPWTLTIPILAGIGTALIGSSAYYFDTWWNNSSGEKGAKTYAKMHDPSLLRNVSMNLYNPENKITMALTSKDISTYHKVIGLLNKEDCVSPNESALLLTEPGVNEILVGNDGIPDINKNVLIHPVKAKALLIKNVLTLERQLGTDNQIELVKAVEQEYKQYSLGKQTC